ncbi:MAG: pyridoxamine 5'-phosphate oxidase family protein [Acidimicrobiia bacterium]
MAAREPVSEERIDIYDLDVIPWRRAREALEGAAGTRTTHVLSTVGADGNAHAVPVGAIWLDDSFLFSAGEGTRKVRNLAHNPRCVVTVSLPDIDLVVEGDAAKVTDDATLQRAAAFYNEHGWSPTVRDGAFVAEYSAPSAGPPPWNLYQITPVTAFGVLTVDPGGATRWRFEVA